MKVDTHTAKQLFQKDIRYLIPTFQRPYVWNQEDQWEPLWVDLRNTAEQYLDELATGASEQEAVQKTSTHFMGAIVLKQRPTATASVEERDVIDGQQRMTTLQLVLDAAQECFELLEYRKEAQHLKRLVLNDYVDGDEAFKLWPTAMDQEAFRAAMTNGAETEGFEESRIAQAHSFFMLQITEWVKNGGNPEEAERRAHGLETALLGLLEVVVIDLDAADDAFIIFETLNARGTPLLASDLVKNFVMQTAESRGLQPEVLHERYWEVFEHVWWREEVRQGRTSRPRIDTLLDYWLEMRLHEEVASYDVFQKFRRHMEDRDRDVTEVLGHLKETALAWRELDSLESSSSTGKFVYRWKWIEVGPLTPLVLRLFELNRNGILGDESLRVAMEHVESFLMRRMICRMTTKNYNKLFLELLRQVDEGKLDSADVSISVYLANQDADAGLWPQDKDIHQAVVHLPIYRLLTRGRLRLVLEAIEESMRTKHSEEQAVPHKLTIEHIMPRKWREHWPLPVDTDPLEAVDRREGLIHTLGNLTLVTKTLNPSMSNGSWESKRKALHKHSVLHMTKDAIDQAGDSWTEEDICARSGRMAEIICKAWKRPLI